MRPGLILYGAPATGKDTITAEIIRLDQAFEHFKRLKSGSGRTTGYRMIGPDEVASLRQTPGAILWENSRYAATYLVDRSGLEQRWEADRIPIVHLGQVEAIEAVIDATKSGASWTIVELHCRPAVLAERIRSRGTGDEEQRFAALEQTPRLPRADIRIDTESVPASEAARLITKHVRDRWKSSTKA